MSKRKNDKPPLRCFDCIWCEVTGYWETYWSRFDGPHYCEDCGKELTERKTEDINKDDGIFLEQI